MDLAICTIQRDRGRWLREWVAFHYLVGFRKFYIFLHRCIDDSAQVVLDLSKYFDITAFTLSDDIDRPQLAAYQHCYSNYGDKHDWIAFIDGDEFLFSPGGLDISLKLDFFQNKPIGALGVYWMCFGSSGHVNEPTGLVTDNYRYRSEVGFRANRHFKSIVRGRQGSAFSILQNSHYFRTNDGSYDTRMRPLIHGLMDHEPCFEILRINHYVTQSREYFDSFKKNSGAADAGSQVVRSEDWWREHDRNEVFDDSLIHLRLDLIRTLMECSKP